MFLKRIFCPGMVKPSGQMVQDVQPVVQMTHRLNFAASVVQPVQTKSDVQK